MRVLVVVLMIAGALASAAPAHADLFGCRNTPIICEAMQPQPQSPYQDSEYYRTQRWTERNYGLPSPQEQRQQWMHEDAMRQNFQNNCSRYDPNCMRNFDWR